MYMHEYGHYLDSQLFGMHYLPVIGIPSLISVAGNKQIAGEDTGVSTHKMYWAEIRANKNAKEYFSERPYFGVDWNRPYHIWGEDYLHLGTTIETFYPTKKR